MSLSFCVLASGSGGNCTVVSLPGAASRHLLIDAGLAPKATAERLAPLGVTLDDLDHILLTHLDRDHFHPGWVRTVSDLGIRVHVHARHRDRAVRQDAPVAELEPFRDGVDLGCGAHAEGVLLPHDQMGSVGYVLEHEGTRLGFATDLGRDTRALRDHFRDLDAVALESNYDRRLLLASSRPPFLKRRIMGGQGHLSNRQALDVVRRIAQRSPLRHVVLLHLSRTCNDSRLVQALYAKRATDLLDRITITNQFVPSPRLVVGGGEAAALRRGEQMVMFS